MDPGHLHRKRPARRKGLSRNPNGTGSVYQEGNQWRAAVTLEGGRRIRRRVPSEEAGSAKVAGLQQRNRLGKLRTTGRQSLAQFLAEWLEGRQAEVRARTLRPNTWEHYRTRLVHVTRELGTVQLDRLAPIQLRRLSVSMLKRGFSPTTVHGVPRVLSIALIDAVKWRLLESSPAADMTPPQPKPRAPEAFTTAEIRQLLASTEGTRWHALWTLLASHGLRIGEALALRWSDYDQASGELRIQETTTRPPEGGIVRGPVKTGSSKRPIVLCQVARKALAQHAVITKKAQLAALRWTDHELIFPNTQGTLMYHSVARKALERDLRRAGLRAASPHLFRHSIATRLLDDRENISMVQHLLGHSNERTLLQFYSHVSREMMVALAAHIDALLADPPEAKPG
jgi:integrase